MLRGLAANKSSNCLPLDEENGLVMDGKKKGKGQYINGHEHSDVVAYCQQVFLPAWTCLQS